MWAQVDAAQCTKSWCWVFCVLYYMPVICYVPNRTQFRYWTCDVLSLTSEIERWPTTDIIRIQVPKVTSVQQLRFMLPSRCIHLLNEPCSGAFFWCISALGAQLAWNVCINCINLYQVELPIDPELSLNLKMMLDSKRQQKFLFQCHHVQLYHLGQGFLMFK